MSEQIVYRHPIEGLVRSIGKRMTPELKQRLREVGLDLDVPIPRNTPRIVFADALRISAKHLYPNEEEQEGFRRLGIGVIEGVEHTLLGKALVAMWPIFGPERVVVRIQENFATVNNYLKTELITHSPSHHVIRVSECNGNPGYLQGIIEAGLLKAGAKELKIDPFDFDGHACSYRVQWKA